MVRLSNKLFHLFAYDKLNYADAIIALEFANTNQLTGQICGVRFIAASEEILFNFHTLFHSAVAPLNLLVDPN